jgi:ketosteroid isomerase-like protein
MAEEGGVMTDARADVGTQYVTALAAKDTAALLDLFAPDVSFRGMTPGRFWEAVSATELVHDVLYVWFGPSDTVEAIDHVETGRVVHRHRVDYRFRVRGGEGMYAVDQRAYFDLDDGGRICRMHTTCAGFQLLPGSHA